MSAARCTKAQLAADLEASHVAYQHVSAINESLSAECMALREQLRESQLLLLSIKRAAPVITATSTWREAAAKAKQLAMSTGRSVLVG